MAPCVSTFIQLFLFAMICLSALFCRCLALRADVMNGQIICLNLKSEMLLNACGKGRKVKVADFAASVAKKMVVRLCDLVKAIGSAVDALWKFPWA